VISVVVPAYEERESLVALHAEIAHVAHARELELEILFVDDGSRDGTWDVIRELIRHDPRVGAIRFRRNFGKSAALTAGFAAARGEIVITLDADLQDDPAEIPVLLRELDGGLDAVNGWKRKRYDPRRKVWPSRVFNYLVSRLTGVHLHDHNCGMKAYRAEVLRELRLYGERHRFMPVLAAARGFRVGEVEIRHRPRRHGATKFGASRFLKGFLDLLTVKFLTAFGQRPQHVLGSLGLATFLGGLVGLVYLTMTWFVRLVDAQAYLPLSNRPLLTYSTAALLLGAQMLSIGILAEMLTAYGEQRSDGYSIADQCGVLGAVAAESHGRRSEDRRAGDRRTFRSREVA
jgi:glycosyltransferase involved in cell wall biosynthesis